jgi:serine/threonine protein kinase
MISDLRPGLQFHHYQLLEQIGVGGQGVVWSAEDLQRNDIVAIKFNEVLGSEEQQADDEMFARQLGKLLKVQHANILPIYDCGLENYVRYLVSPYVAGGSIFERLKNGPLPLEDALRLSNEIASALDYLHGEGIIHRDITSSNVLLNLRNHAYLADFGLARIISNTTLPMHTGRGTALYSPPEQHKRLEITPMSDIYSFGILLFEIFTGKLPWDGETVLGIQQLYSNIELPDPLELNNTLPPLMKDVLRRATAVDPTRRPASGAEVMKMIHYIFNNKNYSPVVELVNDRASALAHDADDLFDQYIGHWSMDDSSKNELGLTKFALIDIDFKKREESKLQDKTARFMLFHALLYGHNDEFWWPKVKDPKDRLNISLALFNIQNEEISIRVLDYLVKDKISHLMSGEQSAQVTASLLDVASRSTVAPASSHKLLAGLQTLVPLASAWGNSTLSSELTKTLGTLAVEDSDVGDQAARLAGHLRSTPTVNLILKNVAPDRMIPTLLEVQHSAGYLPTFIPGYVRLRVTLEWIGRRLTLQPSQLFGAYMLALVGATFGIGSQVYLTYRLPQFMDIARISSSLEQGLIIGAIFSLGIFLTRVIVERFSVAKAFPRIVLGTVTGGIGMNIALFTFHVLFLNTPPDGFLITLGCTLMAFAYALSGLMRKRGLRMVLTISAFVLAISGTWWMHATMAGSVTQLTPLFRYDYNWTQWQVFLTSLIVAAWMGVFGNLIELNVEDA